MVEPILYWLGQSVVSSFALSMLNMDIQRHAPLPPGPKIIAANHPSTTDPFLMLTLTREQMSVLINDVLFHVPLFGTYLRHSGHLSVVEGRGSDVLTRGARLLKRGRTLVVFPEGAISPLQGGFHKPHTGVARLALKSGAPVIPVGIHLRRDRLHLIETQVSGKSEVGTWYIRGPYAITVGRPMYFEGDVENQDLVRTVTDKVMQQIISLAEQSSYRLGKGAPRPRLQTSIAWNLAVKASLYCQLLLAAVLAQTRPGL